MMHRPAATRWPERVIGFHVGRMGRGSAAPVLDVFPGTLYIPAETANRVATGGENAQERGSKDKAGNGFGFCFHDVRYW